MKSLEDIRRRYSGKSNSEGDSSTQSSSKGPASDQEPKDKESSSTPDVSTKPEELIYPGSSDPDFSTIDFSGSIIANDLGLLYINETINLGAIFPKSARDSSRDEYPPTDACQSAKMPTSLSIPPNPMEINSLDKNQAQQSDSKCSRTDYCASSAANMKMPPTSNSPTSNLPPGRPYPSDQDASPTACHFLKKQTPPSSSSESMVPAEALNIATSSSKSGSKLISRSMDRQPMDGTNQEASTAKCQIVKNQTIATPNGAAEPSEQSYPDEDRIHHSNLEFSEMDFSSSRAANDLNMLYINESTRKLFPGSFSGSNLCASTVMIRQTSQTDGDDSMSMDLGVPAKAVDVKNAKLTKNIRSSIAIAGSTAGNHEVAHQQLSPKSLSDGNFPRFGVKTLNPQIGTSIPQMSCESFQTLMFNQLDQFVKPDAEGHVAHIESIGGCSQGVLKNSTDGTQTTVANTRSHLSSEEIPRNDEMNLKLSSNADEANSSSFKRIQIVKESEVRQLINSRTIQESDGKMKLDLISGINENTQHTIQSLGENPCGESENLPIDSKTPLGKQTLEKTIEAISYYGFVPDIHSTFGSPVSLQPSLGLLSNIPEESRESGVVSQDPEVSPPSGTPAAISNPVNLDGSASPQSRPTNSSVEGLASSMKSKHLDSNGNVSECSNSLTPRDVFVKALPAQQLLAESRNFNLDHGSGADEPEVYDLPTPNDYLEHKWFPQKTRKMVLGTSGCFYDGELHNNKMHGHGRFYFGKDHYIEGDWEANSLIEPSACILAAESVNCTISIFKNLNFYFVSIFEFDFIAKAIAKSFKELDFSKSVAGLRASFFGKFKILEILNDELRSKRDLMLKEFKVALKLATAEDADSVKNATFLFLLGEYAKRLDAGSVLHAIQTSNVFPPSLHAAATNLLEIETRFKLRYQAINLCFNVSELAPYLDVREIIFNKYADQVTEHRRSLLMKCPTNFTNLMEMIQKLPGEKIVYVTREDVGAFHHLLSLPCANNDETCNYIRNLFAGFLEEFLRRLQSINSETLPCAVIPLISPVFGYLYKSFSEIVEEIVGLVDECQFQDMLCIDHDWNWKLKMDIRWPVDQDTNPQTLVHPKMSKRKSILYRKSLEAQYYAIYQMLIFFSPGNYLRDRIFAFEFNVLKLDPSWWLRAPNDDVPVIFELAEVEDLSNDRLSWLYILDYTVHQLFKENPRTVKLIKLYNPLLQGYISFVQKSVADTHESFRVLTHSIIQFLVFSSPYFTESTKKLSLDCEVLSYQMWTMTAAARELELGTVTLTNFRDLIEEYKRYWIHHPFVDVRTQLSPDYFTNQISALMQKFGETVRFSLGRDVPIISLVRYLRSLNDFMEDLENIDFLNCWYVKSDIYDESVMDKIDNKISANKHCSYLVTNIDGFIELMKGKPMPNHYIITVVTRLIEYINYFLNRSYSGSNVSEQMSNIERLESTGMLLDAIRQSFMYLKEQPEYVDFETFMKESTEPFMRIVHESKDLDDVKNRTYTVKDSFWYIRNMDEIGINQAITLFASVNDCPISDKLSDCYNLYLEHYNSCIETYCSYSRDGLTHDECLVAVSRVMKIPGQIHFSRWSEDFKTKEIPPLLAGMSAMWSILVSKDVSSTGKFLKPHCIQILCIMRLLSVDKPKGAENHLAQVLTGQGKSLILGLLSSVLALTGHKVRVVCYSEYLSTRDENDFKEFFQQFNIADSISYGTFQDMANGFLKPLCNGKRTNLRKMVCDRVLYHRDWVSLGSVLTESSDTVLLIDEVDVFFNDHFYSHCYDSLTTVYIPGLANVQHAMWKIAKDNVCNAVQVKRLTEKHISEQMNLGDPPYREWECFRKKPGTFKLLMDDSNGKSRIKEYTNRSLTDEHLMKMAEDAVLLSCSKEMDRMFRLNEEGVVCMRNAAGQYLPGIIESYRNTFAYLKLKGLECVPSNDKNFGYLLLKTGKISYARMPCQFPLIMGVSGTLNNLSAHEKIGIDSYNIKEFSILPSFFGESSLKFHAETDFTFVMEQQDWLNQIYHKANAMVQSLRAVLIFFDSEVRLNLFAEEYKTKFDRVNEITLNTDSHLRDLYINEAGICCTVTLATRVMGRGLDYKSSLAVEKNGGIHVIQSFFSVEVKEEIQIRGRTARKDNKGSYELILCKEHLVQKKIIQDDPQAEYTYASLQLIRKQLMDKIGKRHADMIMKSEHDHEITMMYYGLSQFNNAAPQTIVLSD